MQMTSSGEAAAFFLARTIVVAALFFITPRFLAPLYLELARSGGRGMLMGLSLGVSATTWLVTLAFFLALRPVFGGAPTVGAASPRQSQLISSGEEIVAYLLTAVIVIVVLLGFNTFALPGIYAAIRASGRTDLQWPVSITIAVVSATIFFILFITLRRAMTPPARAAGPAS